jgi:hypothetical protein
VELVVVGRCVGGRDIYRSVLQSGDGWWSDMGVAATGQRERRLSVFLGRDGVGVDLAPVAVRSGVDPCSLYRITG